MAFIWKYCKRGRNPWGNAHVANTVSHKVTKFNEEQDHTRGLAKFNEEHVPYKRDPLNETLPFVVVFCV